MQGSSCWLSKEEILSENLWEPFLIQLHAIAGGGPVVTVVVAKDVHVQLSPSLRVTELSFLTVCVKPILNIACSFPQLPFR